MANCIRCHKSIMDDGAIYCPYCGAKQIRNVTRRRRGNGQGAVYKRGSTYTVKITVGWQVDDQGKLHRHYASKGGFATAKQAGAYADQLANRGQKKTHTLAHYWSIFENADMLKLSESKQTAYRIAYKKLGRLVYMDIPTITIQAMRAQVNKACPTYYTAKDAKVLLTKLYALADVEGIGNPRLPGYIILPQMKTEQRTPFSNEQLQKLWAAYDAGADLIGYVLLMIYTGMMPGQLLQVRKSQIDYEKRVIIGAGLKTDVRKKTPISLSQLIIPVVQHLQTLYPKSKKLLGINKDKFYRLYHDAITAAGCRDLPPYACRHTTATALAIGQGVAPDIIKRVMRWSTTQMLNRYAHPTMDDALTAVDLLKKG